MNERVRQMLVQINALEAEIEAEMNLQKAHWRYQLHGKRVEFEQSIKDAHRKLKLGIFRWFLTVHPQDYLTAPIIYGMVIPIVLFDLCIMFYQYTCFPIYGIARVKRSDYFAYDQQHLAYLNFIEKFDCLYCSYGNGLMAFATEIFARTEQYFCPIKHSHKIFGLHSRNRFFMEYGDAVDLHKKFEKIRGDLRNENIITPKE
jgi:hypothetical protein